MEIRVKEWRIAGSRYHMTANATSVSATSVGLNGSDFSTYFLRTLFDELGSKTFFLIAILSAWCPWEGARGHDDRNIQMLLVLVGSYVADVVRVMVADFADDGKQFSCAFDVSCCIIFLLLAAKARVELTRLDARELRTKFATSADSSSGSADIEKSDATEWNTTAFSSFFMAQAESSETPRTQYGTAEQYVPADGVLSNRPSDRTVSTVLAFLVPAVLVFLAEADNKAIDDFPLTGLKGAGSNIGALLAFLTSNILAVLLGLFCERTLSDHRLSFIVSVTLFGLSFISATEALLYLDAARTQQTQTGVVAFLSLFTGSRRQPKASS